MPSYGPLPFASTEADFVAIWHTQRDFFFSQAAELQFFPRRGVPARLSLVAAFSAGWKGKWALLTGSGANHVRSTAPPPSLQANFFDARRGHRFAGRHLFAPAEAETPGQWDVVVC